MKNFMLRITRVLLLIGAPCFAAAQESTFISRPAVQAFIQHMVDKHHFDRPMLEAWLSAVEIQPSIITAMTKPAEKLPWYRYQAIFLTPARIEGGVRFWQENKAQLVQAQAQYGVPAEIIVAILGVETFYGQHTGKYWVLDSLATLGFDYPPRSTFFLSELEEFFILAREEQWDPTTIKGSYAGAMGKGQFISSSYRRYAVDFDGDGKRDLLTQNADAIGSVAHYFQAHGWQPDGTIVIPAKIVGTKYASLVASKTHPKPAHTIHALAQSEVYPQKAALSASTTQPFALVQLEGDKGPEFWLGAQNFYVITRYNHSDHYAMAVYRLSEQIKAAYKG